MDTMIDWIYQRDRADYLLGYACSLLEGATAMERFIMQEAYYSTGEIRFMSPTEVRAFAKEPISRVIDDLRWGKLVSPRIDEKDWQTVLSRIGEPGARIYDGDNPVPIDDWPSADRPPKRSDFVYFYLLVKTMYVRLKSELQRTEIDSSTVIKMGVLCNELTGAKTFEDVASLAEIEGRLWLAWLNS